MTDAISITKLFWERHSRELLLGLLVCLVLTAGFFFSPITTGDDWQTFYGAAKQALAGQNLYVMPVTFTFYSNPPWVVMALVPLSLLPFRWGWAVVCMGSFLAALAIAYRWRLSLLKTVLILLSPSMLYILLHGQIDLILLAGIWLPQEWWVLVALAKPQVAFGLLAGIPRSRWVRAMLILAGIVILTLALFGNWPLDLLRQPHPFAKEGHNLWLGLWPFQVPAGVALILLGFSRSDERLLVAGSPFLFPYATMSNLIGPWLAVNYYLKDWQALIVWVSWWGAVIYRGVGGG